MFTRILRSLSPFITHPTFLLQKGFGRANNSRNDNFKFPKKLLMAAVPAAVGVSLTKEEEDDEPKSGKSFRERKINEYENRIRTFSTPDKIFRYFATVRVDDVVYMTIDDLYRAITPGEMQPVSLGLDRFRTTTREEVKEKSRKNEGTVLGNVFPDGLISFLDYLLIISLISIPLWHVEIWFNMMDLDGNGIITLEEFIKMKELVIGRSSIGNRHRETSHGTHSSSRKGTTCLEKFFFGDSLDGKIELESFVSFLEKLQRDMADHDFNRYPEGKIPAEEFAESFAFYTHMSSAKKRHVLKKLNNRETKLFVSYEDHLHFLQLLTRIDDLILVLDFYDLADVIFDRESLKRLSRIVTGRELSASMVEILFTVLDENGDGNLSNQEFLFLLKKALSRGLDKPMDTQFLRTISILFNCAVKS